MAKGKKRSSLTGHALTTGLDYFGKRAKRAEAHAERGRRADEAAGLQRRGMRARAAGGAVRKLLKKGGRKKAKHIIGKAVLGYGINALGAHIRHRASRDRADAEFNRQEGQHRGSLATKIVGGLAGAAAGTASKYFFG